MRRAIPADALLALMGHRDSRMSGHYDHPETADRIKALEGVRDQTSAQAFIDAIRRAMEKTPPKTTRALDRVDNPETEESMTDAKSHESVRDLYLKHIEIWDKYHQAKEQLVWLATSALLLFIVSTTALLIGNTPRWAGNEILRYCIAGGILLVSALSTLFAWRQNTLKVRAVTTQNALDDMLHRWGGESEPTGADIESAVKAWTNLCKRQRCAKSRRNGWPGWLLIILMGIMTFAVPALIAFFRDP
jgi:hypothetical protein